MQRGLRIALLSYRGNPYSGGQGVYVRHLSAALARVGHTVTVFSGQPYPDRVDGVSLVRVPSLDLYRDNSFRTPSLRDFRDWIDVVEFADFCSAGFPEPLTFSLRVKRMLLEQKQRFDIVHDNQGLGLGLLSLQRAGVPVVATVHHPIVIDRDLELSREPRAMKRLMLRRWYRFHAMQDRVARRLPRLITVSEQSRCDMARVMGVDPARVRVVRLAVDDSVFKPRPGVQRVKGRIFSVASADVPLKGVVPLLHAVATVRTRRPLELVLLGEARNGGAVERAVRDLRLSDIVRFVRGIDDAGVARQYAEAEVSVVPSLHEGLSIPALQAMACGVPLVTTTAGALPEVVGHDGEAALLVPPGDVSALASAIDRVLSDAALRRRLGEAALRRSRERSDWTATALATAAVYREVLGGTGVGYGRLGPAGE